MHNKLATNFWNKSLQQKNWNLASKELAEKNFQDKQLVDSSFTQTAKGAFKEELLTACSPEASDNKQPFSTSLGQQSVAKAASPRELLPAFLPGAPGEQELLQQELSEAQLADNNFFQNTFATTSLQPRPSARQLQRQQLEEENFTANSLEALCLSRTS